MDKETALRFQEALDEAVADLEIPGLQACVRTPQDRTWCGAGGWADESSGEELRPDHLMRIGSVSKTFTAVIILRLAEEGRLGLDDPISEWFPDFPGSSGITVRQLLGHTSGIMNSTDSWRVRISGVIPLKTGPLEQIDISAGQPLYFPPGEGYHYSNTNFLMLGVIAEKITGKTIERLVREELLEPLGLDHTYFPTRETVPPTLITGIDYDLLPIPGYRHSPENDKWAAMAWAAGAMVSNAEDLRIWIDALFEEGVVNPGTLTEMTAFRNIREEDDPDRTGYGLGIARYQFDREELWGHTGTIPGFGAFAGRSPRNNYTITLVASRSQLPHVEVLRRLVREIFK